MNANEQELAQLQAAERIEALAAQLKEVAEGIREARKIDEFLGAGADLAELIATRSGRTHEEAVALVRDFVVEATQPKPVE